MKFKRLLLLFLLIPAFLTADVSKTKAQKEDFVLDQAMVVDAKPVDPRAVILKDYFDKHNSPLADHAQDFIDAADTYHMDWKLVPAISGVESTFGKQIPGGFNAWGWGVYGDQALFFTSWRAAIFEVSRGLKQNYIDKGLTDPYAMNRVYASSPVWGGHVAYFLGDIDNFSKTYDNPTQLTLETSQSKVNTAGSSGELTMKFVSIGGI